MCAWPHAPRPRTPRPTCARAPPSPPRSRCTGYRPILDAFKTFAKTDPKAYTEEAIAAAKGLPRGAPAAANGCGANGCGANGCGANGCGSTAHAGSANGGVANGHGGAGTKVCPTSGLPCDCGMTSAKGGSEVFVMGAAGAGKTAAQLGPQPGTCEPIFPPELKGRPVQELCMPGAFRGRGW